MLQIMLTAMINFYNFCPSCGCEMCLVDHALGKRSNKKADQRRLTFQHYLTFD